jgi:hypothetical protein
MNSVFDRSTAKRGAFECVNARAGALELALLQSHSALGGDDWVDALDPRLPAEPVLVCSQHQESHVTPPLWFHKLILLGVALGAGAFAFGYLAAAWLL